MDPVRQYIDQIIDYVETHSIQPEADRQRFAETLRRETKEAASLKDTFTPLAQALKNLGDNHSGLIEPARWTNLMRKEQTLPTGVMRGDIAYLQMPGFNVNEKTSATEYADHCHRLIAELDAQNPKGWILDLRGNTGGSSWPMIAGAGPLFEGGDQQEDGLLGYFVTRKGREESWGYKDGQSWGASEAGKWVNAQATTPYHLKNPQAPVAVLMGERTVSAGETVCVAAGGLGPRVRTFGADSGGMATGNVGVPGLPDTGAVVLLAISSYADRHGRPLDRTLHPDVRIPESGPDDPVPAAALAWIRETAAPSPSRHPRAPAGPGS